MKSIKLSGKNQIVLPKAAREAMDVKGGDELLVVVKGHTTLILPKPRKYISTLGRKELSFHPAYPVHPCK